MSLITEQERKSEKGQVPGMNSREDQGQRRDCFSRDPQEGNNWRQKETHSVRNEIRDSVWRKLLTYTDREAIDGLPTMKLLQLSVKYQQEKASAAKK